MNNLTLRFSRIASCILALVFVVALSVVAPARVHAAMSAMSITSGAITANSIAVSTALTQTTINFTPASAISSGQLLKVVLNGTVAAASIASADITVGGGCSGTVSITTVTISTANPTLDITGVTCTAATPATVVIATGKLTSSATANNYGISLTSPSDTGSFLFYVGDENDVSVRAVVDPSISFVIRNSADDGDQANVGGGATGPNLCDLGNLSNSGVQSCAYRLKISTNAVNGYTVNIATDGDLDNTSSAIDNVVEGNTVQSGTEGYGIALTGGSATGGSITEAGDFSDDDTPIGTGTNTTLISSDGPNNPGATDTTNTALVTHRAESDSGTETGSYAQLVTYTVTASF